MFEIFITLVVQKISPVKPCLLRLQGKSTSCTPLDMFSYSAVLAAPAFEYTITTVTHMKCRNERK